jgi:hypothetical protein
MLMIWGAAMVEVGGATPNRDSRGRPLIYAVAPDGDGDRITPMRPWPALFRFALAAIAMLAVGCVSGVMVVWLVLAPNIPTGAMSEELRAPVPAQIGQTLDQRGAEPTAIVTQPLSVTPPTAERLGRVSQGTDRTSAIVKRRPDGMPQMIAPVDIQAGHSRAVRITPPRSGGSHPAAGRCYASET